jgi:hypothetical protein
MWRRARTMHTKFSKLQTVMCYVDYGYKTSTVLINMHAPKDLPHVLPGYAGTSTAS